MAAITASSITTESLGSLTLKIVALTATSTSDTYTYSSTAPVVAYWVEGNPGNYVTFASTTGIFTIVNTSGTNAYNLFILQRGV